MEKDTEKALKESIMKGNLIQSMNLRNKRNGIFYSKVTGKYQTSSIESKYYLLESRTLAGFLRRL